VTRVHFLGSGDAFGSGGRFQACILIDHPGGRMLLDCGASSLVAMKRASVDPASIPLVVISHLHGDHFGGIPFLVLDGQFSRRELPLTVVGPPGTRRRVEEAMEVLFPGSSGVQRRFAMNVIEIEPRQPLALQAASVTAFPVSHASGAPAYAYRLELDDAVVAYSGDTAWDPALLEAARGADLFIVEGYYREKQVLFHLDIATLASQRAELDCRRIILTHMSDDVLNNPPPGWDLAHDGLAVELPASRT
jgi:ribonuclease BN (tRNA processing enzyme)